MKVISHERVARIAGEGYAKHTRVVFGKKGIPITEASAKVCANNFCCYGAAQVLFNGLKGGSEAFRRWYAADRRVRTRWLKMPSAPEGWSNEEYRHRRWAVLLRHAQRFHGLSA